MFRFNEHATSVIKNNISDSLKKCGIRAKTMLENNNRAISAVNKFDASELEHLYIWVRLMPYKNTDKYIVDISNIILPDSKRGCGTFDIIYNRLKNCKYVEAVTITSPCTNSMYSWLNKNKLKEISLGVWA